MKCDLHVHTRHSGMCTVPGLRRICGESYNQPREDIAEAHRQREPALLADFAAREDLGGSDAHALASVGCADTVVPHARDKRDYLDGLRRGLGRVRGETGGYLKLTRDVWSIGRGMVKSNPWTLPVALLGVAVPPVTLGNYVVESVFARWWMSRCLQSRALRVANPAARAVVEAA